VTWPDYVSYPSAMRKLPLLLLLFSSALISAQQMSTPALQMISSYPATLHEKLGSSCELIQPVTLRQYKEYDALALLGSSDETYSPELRKGDYVALSTAVPKEVANSAKKSGFEVHAESTEVSGLNTIPTTNGSSCPDLQLASAEANNRRYERRADLQKHLHQVGSDANLQPVIIQQVQPESVPDSQPGTQSAGNPKVKEGTTMLMMVVGVDGKVQDVQVVRSLDVALDQRAIEAVQKWRFSPARMKGLPVPTQIAAEINFHLH
jgi:TonB family protein